MGDLPKDERAVSGESGNVKRDRPLLVHLTTVDMSLVLLLGPQLRAFQDAGYEVVAVSAPGPYVAELESWGIRHVPLQHATRAMAPSRDGRALMELRSLFRHLRPDLVHTHTPKAGLYGRFSAWAAGVPAIVNTVHGLYALPSDRWAKRALVYGLERMASSCSHAELVQNVEDVETLVGIGVPRRKLTLLGNGIDLARFDPSRISATHVGELRRQLGAGSSDVVCLLVGRLVAEKGYRDVFDAATILRARVPNVRFVVVGPHEPEKGDGITESDLRRAKGEGGVRFLGLRHDVEDLYAASDLFVLASHREGFPRSAMEAAAMGLPVIATNIRGCRQVVDEGVTGLLIPERNASALADAVAALAADAPLRRGMGRAGRAKANLEFDQRHVIDITLQTYERLMHRRRALARP